MVNDLIQEVVIDWFQITIFPKKEHVNAYSVCYKNFNYLEKVVPVLFYELFNINPNDLIKESSGLNGYMIRYTYKDISVMCNPEREDMGVNILLTGTGCRDFEDLGIGWVELFNRLNNYDINFNRIDIAIDTFSKEFFTLDKLKKYIKNHLCVSKFRSILIFEKHDINSYNYLGHQIQFGSKASDVEVTFYDKYLERASAGYIVSSDIDFWVRTELRFRHEKARDLYSHLTQDPDYMLFIFDVLYALIDFKNPFSKDSNVRRRDTVFWWSSFLSTKNKLKLSTRSSERKITKIYNWLLEDTSKSNLMVYLSKLPNVKLDSISIDLLYSLLIRGSEHIKDKDLKIINDYRISNKLEPFTKELLLDYISDVKNSYLEE